MGEGVIWPHLGESGNCKVKVLLAVRSEPRFIPLPPRKVVLAVIAKFIVK